MTTRLVDFVFHGPMRVRPSQRKFAQGNLVMPEHVHLLLSEPERSNLAVVLQMLQQIVSRKLNEHATAPFWTWSSARHYATGEECGVEIESR